MGLIERMKFFISLISSFSSEYSAYLYDAQDTLVRPRLLYCLYSTHHSQRPRNVGPNSAFATLETRVGEDEKYGLSTSLPEHLYSTKGDTQYVNERDLDSQLPLKYGHSQNHISESLGLDSVPEYRLSEHDSDTWLSKPNEHLNGLLYVNSCEIHPYNKGKNFIETESNRNIIAGI